MTRFADPSRCPDCRTTLVPGSQRCGRCGLDLSGALGQRLFHTLTTADDLLAQLRARSDRVEVPLATPAGVGASHLGGPSDQRDHPAAALPPHPAPGTVRPSSVPKILLSLGATCLLVAALVFLAVAWGVMGVGGRTATLVGLTVLTGGLTALSARHGLRGAVEALGLVTTGLAVLDLVGARSAGWLGEPSDATFAVALGALMVGGGIAATTALVRTPARGFAAGELTAVAGSLLVFWGLGIGSWAGTDVRLLVGTLVVGALAGGVWTRVETGTVTFRLAAFGTSMVAVGSWLAQSASAVARATDDPSVTALWGDLEVWPLLASVAIGVGLAAVRPVPRVARLLALGVSVALAGIAITLPSYDETATVTTLTVAAAVLLVAIGVVAAPRPWGAAGVGALALGSVVLLVPALGIAAGSVEAYVETAARAWTGTPGDTVATANVGSDVGAPWLLPLCVAVILLAAAAGLRLLDDVRELPVRPALAVAGGIVAVSGAAAVLHYPVPVWAVLAGLLAAATAVLAGGIRRPSRTLSGLAGVLVALAVPLSFSGEHLTATTLAVALLLVAAAHLLSRDEVVDDVAAGLLPFVLAGLVWSGGAALEVDGPWRSLVGLLLLGGLTLGRGAVERFREDRPSVTLVEVCSGLAAMPLAAAGVASAVATEASVWLAVYLTVAGGVASALALIRSDRRKVAWLGGFLLAAATWVRLEDLGVHEPEAYTLPSALALLAVGLVHLRRVPGSSTQTALGAGLALALVPSLLWVLVDPVGVRAVLLGLACLALVVSGVQARWSAPLVHGAVVGALVVLREAGPMVGDSVPRWALLGAAGVLLIGLGVTWEARMRDAKRAVGYVRSLR